MKNEWRERASEARVGEAPKLDEVQRRASLSPLRSAREHSAFDGHSVSSSSRGRADASAAPGEPGGEGEDERDNAQDGRTQGKRRERQRCGLRRLGGNARQKHL